MKSDLTIGLGRAAMLRALLAVGFAIPLYAWWLGSPEATLAYDRAVGALASPLAGALAGQGVLLMRSPQNPGHVGVFLRPGDAISVGHVPPPGPLAVVRTDRAHFNLPLLLALVLVWPVAARPGPAASRGRALARKGALLAGSLLALYLLHVAGFAVEVLNAFAQGSERLNAPAWSGTARSSWGTASWFFLLIGGPFFPVLVVAGASRVLRGRI